MVLTARAQLRDVVFEGLRAREYQRFEISKFYTKYLQVCEFMCICAGVCVYVCVFVSCM